jgi:hypothetical protein
MRSMFGLVALLIGGCAATPIPSQSPAATDLVGTDELVIGKVVAIDPAAPAITLDVVQWFDGPDAANEAARSDGLIGLAEDLPGRRPRRGRRALAGSTGPGPPRRWDAR